MCDHQCRRGATDVSAFDGLASSTAVMMYNLLGYFLLFVSSSVGSGTHGTSLNVSLTVPRRRLERDHNGEPLFFKVSHAHFIEFATSPDGPRFDELPPPHIDWIPLVHISSHPLPPPALSVTLSPPFRAASLVSSTANERAEMKLSAPPPTPRKRGS